ncbi:MAG: hypothetical protein AB7P21_30185 [Lautropia sp.]
MAATLAAIHELRGDLSQLKANVEKLPDRLQAATDPAAARIERASEALKAHATSLAQRSIGATTTARSAPTDPGPRAPETEAAPTRIPTRSEMARRFSLGHLVMVAIFGVVLGILLAAALNIRIPGLSY